jgi:GT2 family glycosyltransferase
MLINVCIVTVTYGCRAKYVKRLVNAGLAAGAAELFIFDNGSQSQNAEALNQLVASSRKAHLLRGEKNYGSAGGFKRALEWARRETTCDFIWILDDDNIPDPTALDSLINAYKCLGASTVNILVSYRMLEDQNTNKLVHKRDLLDSVTDGLIVGKRLSLITRIFRKVRKSIKKGGININYPIVRRERASWGGLFINKGVLEKIGHPNEEFYLYGDDFEFSDRLISNGYKIFTIFNSKIVDVDTQLNSAGYFLQHQQDFKAFYSLRNHVYLDYRDNFVSCLFLAIGLISFGLVNVGPSKFFFKRSALILKAIMNGYSGKLGQIEFKKGKI